MFTILSQADRFAADINLELNAGYFSCALPDTQARQAGFPYFRTFKTAAVSPMSSSGEMKKEAGEIALKSHFTTPLFRI